MGAQVKKEYILDQNGERITLKSGEYKSRKVNTIDWNGQDKAEIWRQSWADIANRYLEKLNHAERIDNRSFERQGIDQIPTIHLDVAIHQMEKKGIRTERGDINRAIKLANEKIRNINISIIELENELRQIEKQADEPKPQKQAIPKPTTTKISDKTDTTKKSAPQTKLELTPNPKTKSTPIPKRKHFTKLTLRLTLSTPNFKSLNT